MFVCPEYCSLSITIHHECQADLVNDRISEFTCSRHCKQWEWDKFIAANNPHMSTRSHIWICVGKKNPHPHFSIIYILVDAYLHKIPKLTSIQFKMYHFKFVWNILLQLNSEYVDIYKNQQILTKCNRMSLCCFIYVLHSTLLFWSQGCIWEL